MEISLIAAMGSDRSIGRDNDLMWHLPEDMKFFKETTKGHHVIMGRKNWDSIPLAYRPFKNRVNIVLTKQKDLLAEGAFVFSSLRDALSFAQQGGEEEAFIIGGEQIYKLALEEGWVNNIYLTVIESSFPGAHAFFPNFDESLYTRELLFTQKQDDKHAYSFSTYKYTKA
jgi:dihydrofolate reductase